LSLRYDLDEVPPLAEFLLSGLQWLAISIPGIIIVGKVVCGLHFADLPARITYLQKLSFMVGIALFSQVLWGHRLPLILGPSTVLLIGMIATFGFDVAAVYTSIAVGGCLLFLAAVTGFFGRLQKFFTRRIVAVVLLLIAFTLMPTVLGLFRPPGSVSPVLHLLFAFLLMLLMFAAEWALPPAWKSAIIFFAMIAGGLAWVALFPLSDREAVPRDLPALACFFGGFTASLALAPGVLLSFLFCFLGLSINDLGSIESVSALLDPPDMERRVNRGIAFTGLANLASGLFGVIGPVDFSLSPGVILSTGCASRFTLVLTAVLLILLSFSPLVLGAVGSVPPVVVGSVLLYILVFQVGAGLALIGRAGKGVELESAVVIGLPVLMGTVISILPVRYLGGFPLFLRPLIGNGFVVGVLTALILEHGFQRMRSGGGRGG
jgi:xanthine/uracil permease